MDWYYLSFANDDGFLGGAYVEGTSDEDAFFAALNADINPGGEVLIHGPLPADDLERNVPEAERYRLLSREEVG